MNDIQTGVLRQLPLEAYHKAAGARFGAFAGWSMPLTYPPGVLKEHLHTREHAGLFDISHMKLLEVIGERAVPFLSHACPLDAAALGRGQSKYSLLLADDAGILDDLIITRLADDRFIVVANAGNAANDEAVLRERAEGFAVGIEPLDRVFLALQGPEAEAVLQDAGIDASALTFMTGVETPGRWFVTRSGYTGEDGFEIALPLQGGAELFARLADDPRVQPVGLAARDSLRLEAGLCLHGQDITPDIDPVDAGLVWAIPKALREKGTFVGAEALRRKIAAGPLRRRVGIKAHGRQPVRAETAVFGPDGAAAGVVTSGGFGPSANHPVAIGYVDSALAGNGTMLHAEVRGSRIPVEIVPLPFIAHRYRKGS